MSLDKPSRSRWFVRWLFGLLTISASIAITLLAIELFLRLVCGYLPFSKDQAFKCVRFDPELGWIGKPGFSEKSVLLGRTFQVEINEHGFRDANWPPKEKLGRPRVILLGDSMVFGTGVEAEARVSNLLSTRYGIEALPAALPGWSPVQEWLWLKGRGFSLEPDAVVLMLTLLTDITDLFPPRGTALSHPYLREDERGNPKIAGYPPQKPAKFYGNLQLHSPGGLRGLFMRHTAIYSFTLSRLRRSYKTALFLKRLGLFASPHFVERHSLPISIAVQKRPHIRKYAHLLIKLIIQVSNACEERGVSFGVFLIPTHLQVDRQAWRDALDEFSVQVIGTPDYTGYITDLFEHHLRAGGVDVINPLDAFIEHNTEENPLYIPYDGHWTKAGHTLAAELLYPHIERMLAEAAPREQ